MKLYHTTTPNNNASACRHRHNNDRHYLSPQKSSSPSSDDSTASMSSLSSFDSDELNTSASSNHAENHRQYRSPKSANKNQNIGSPSHKPTKSHRYSSHGNSNSNNKAAATIKSKKGSPTKSQKVGIPKKSQLISLDCEMVGVGGDGSRSSLARVVILDFHGNKLFDEYVQQEEPVTDYRTFVSGIQPIHLQTAEMTLEECRKHVQALLLNKIVIGHALKNDFKVLGIQHPWQLIRDTAKYEPFMQERNNMKWPRKLKDLALERLQRTIQTSDVPHCPCIDAMTAMDLYKSVQIKWEKVIAYKVQRTMEIHMAQQRQEQEMQEQSHKQKQQQQLVVVH